MGVTQDFVKEAKNPQVALLHLAKTLDRIEDVMGEILARLEKQPDEDWIDWFVDLTDGPAFTETQVDEDELVIDVRPVSAAKQHRRTAFARDVLQLQDQTPIDLGMEPGPALETYAVAGPYWLWTTNRKLFMSYGIDVRRAMVEDINEDDVERAKQVGADVLKIEESSDQTYDRIVGGSD